MMMSDTLSKFVDDLFGSIKGYVDRGILPLRARVETLEKRAPDRGADGKDGRDASDEQVARAVELAVARIPPARAGIDGKSVEPAEVEHLVQRAIDALPKPANGLDGARGQKGLDGRDGKDGEAGRDAAAIEPLPAINAERSYPRGTWAKHAGGLWLARSTTDGMHGWDCIMNGLASLEVVADGPRKSTIKSVLSDGQTTTAEFVTSAMIDKGVWAPGEYEPGDCVSWDGSMWACKETTTEKPGTPSWRLTVKKGRDGKDGLRGEKGERGGDGKAGRDLTQMLLDGRKY